MGLAAKSIPPPSWVAPRKHGLARTSPLREDQQRRMSEFFRHWWKSRGLSERALAGYLGVTKSVARNKLEASDGDPQCVLGGLHGLPRRV